MSQTLARLRMMVDEDGYDQRAHYLLGLEYMRLGRWMQAAAEFRRTVELNPDYAPAWKAMGDAYERALIYKEAAVAYRTCIRVAEDLDEKQTAEEARQALEKLPDLALQY
jgi:tetratricopeptide (TPR) repeat protein